MAFEFGSHFVKGIFTVHCDDRITMPLRPFAKAEYQWKNSCHGVGFVVQDQLFTQIHQSATFRVYR